MTFTLTRTGRQAQKRSTSGGMMINGMMEALVEDSRARGLKMQSRNTTALSRGQLKGWECNRCCRILRIASTKGLETRHFELRELWVQEITTGRVKIQHFKIRGVSSVKFAMKLDGSAAEDVHERERCEDVDENRFSRVFFSCVSLHNEIETSVSLASLNLLLFCTMRFVIAAREEPYMF